MHHYVILHLEKERTMYTRAVVLFCSKFLCFTEVPGKERPLLRSTPPGRRTPSTTTYSMRGRGAARPAHRAEQSKPKRDVRVQKL